MKQTTSRTSDQGMLSVWQQAVSQALSDTAFKQALLQRAAELLPSFADHYEKLKTLPHRLRRCRQRQWKGSLAGVALLFALGQTPLFAATINVGKTCTLVRAILAANSDTTATGRCVKGSGADTIVLPAGSTQTVTAVNNATSFGPTGLPVIRSVVIIKGNGSTIRRAPSAPKFRLLAVGTTGTLALQSITLSGGFAPKVAGNNTANDGGGVLNLGGALTIINSTITGNTADRGGGVANQGAPPSFARIRLAITNSTISGNTAVAGNEPTSGWGGGVDIDPYTDLAVTNSTISNNTAAGYGGGIYAITGSFIALTNSTLTGNSSGKRAGGIATGCATLKLTRNLISGNTAPTGAEMSTSAQDCQIADLNFNLFGHNGLTNATAFHLFAPGTTSLTATTNGNAPTALAAILNTALSSNGGSTKTNPLVAGSPAIDAVTDGTCPPPAKDQRGVARPQDGNGDGGPACDLGSFELAGGAAASLAPPGPPTNRSPKPPGPPAPPEQGGPPGPSPPPPPVEPPPPVDQPPVTAPEPPPPPPEPPPSPPPPPPDEPPPPGEPPPPVAQPPPLY